jgi:hypothetical protein
VSRIGRLLGLILALAGFAAARALAPAGHAQVPLPTVTVTTPSLPAPLPPPPTVPIAPTVPTPPPVAISPPPTPAPPPPVQIAPAPTPRVTPPPTTTNVAPPSSTPPAGTPAVPSTGTPAAGSGSTAGSSSGSSSAAAPAGAAAPSESAGRPSSSSSGSPAASSSSAGTGGQTVAGRSSSAARTRPLAAKTHRTKTRVSVLLRFALPAAGKLFLVVRGPAPSCRVAGVVPVRGRKGTNRLFFSGRVQGRRLEPGLYQLSLSTSRRPQPAAPATTVRVVSPRRSVPVTTPAGRSACAPVQAFFDDGATRILRAEALHQQQQQAPIAEPAGTSKAPLRPPLRADGIANGEDEEISGLVPDPVSGSADGGLESFAAIVVLLIVASLLLGMVALVARFLRGSWNP